MPEPYLEIRNVYKSFTLGPHTVEVLRGIDLTLGRGAAAAVTGPSGSGKSTLLHLIGTLDSPTSGTVSIGGVDPFSLPEAELARFRNRTAGFVFQDHHLLPQYTVFENVLLPTLAFKDSRQGSSEWARELLERVGLGHRLDHRPAELSGGERQRVAVARALVNRPTLLLCDEPTGNLDPSNASSIVDLLFALHDETQSVLIVVTHSEEVAERFPVQLKLRDGRCSGA